MMDLLMFCEDSFANLFKGARPIMHLNLREKNGRVKGGVCLMKESIFEVNNILILYISNKPVGSKNKLNQNLLVDIQAREREGS